MQASGTIVAFEAASQLCTTLQNLVETSEYGTATSHGASSAIIQSLVKSQLESDGFVTEVRSRVKLAGFRSDFVKVLDDDAILVEIERGKTIDNNMDMLDFWKCHIHQVAHHLILAVPVWYSSSSGPRPTFASVCKRLAPMFEDQNYTGVWSLNIVGY